jgi:hypothetical protein
VELAAHGGIPGGLPAGLSAGGWGLYFLGPRSAPPGVTMTDLHGVADLQARFNADRGVPGWS